MEVVANLVPDSGMAVSFHVLPAILDLTQAQKLRDTMLHALDGGPVTLDAGEVDRMSTPCIQVILAAGRAAEAENIPFKIRNATLVFQKAFADLGLGQELSNWTN